MDDSRVTIVLTKGKWSRVIRQLQLSDKDNRMLARFVTERLGPGGNGAPSSILIEPGTRLEVLRQAAAECGIKLDD